MNKKYVIVFSICIIAVIFLVISTIQKTGYDNTLLNNNNTKNNNTIYYPHYECVYQDGNNQPDCEYKEQQEIPDQKITPASNTPDAVPDTTTETESSTYRNLINYCYNNVTPSGNIYNYYYKRQVSINPNTLDVIKPIYPYEYLSDIIESENYSNLIYQGDYFVFMCTDEYFSYETCTSANNAFIKCLKENK